VGLSELRSDIISFRHYIQSERGLAENTILAYGRDLDRYARWVVLIQLPNYLKPKLKDLASYVAFLHDEELAPPSIARHLVALKMFYRFLRLEERADATAVDLSVRRSCGNASPKCCRPRRWKHSSSAPQPGDRFFLRDRAMLETLYATGCRATEVVSLKLNDGVYLDSAVLPVRREGQQASAWYR